MHSFTPIMPTPHLCKFRARDKPTEVKIKDNTYLVIADRYDGYGQMTHVYIDQPSGELRVVVWQDNHDAAKPYHFSLVASSLHPGCKSHPAF